MAKFTNLTQNFTMIPNWLINNQNVSLKAKGLFIFLASKPNNFNFSAEGLSKLNKEGITSIKNCLKELENNGLLIRKKIKDNNNRFVGIEYILTDNPLNEKSDGGKPTDGKPIVGEPSNINNKDLHKKEINKKDNIIKEDFLLEKETKNNICDISDFEVLEYEEIKTEKSSLKKEKNIEIEIYPTFDDFWDLYDKKKGKKKCEPKLNKLSQETKEKIMDYIPKYKLETPDVTYRKHPETFLNNESWNDEIILKHNNNNGNGKQQFNSTSEFGVITQTLRDNGLR